MIDPARLRKIRQGSNIKAGELAARMGIKNLNYVFKIERGEKEPTWETVKRIARALEIPSRSLIQDDVLRELAPASESSLAEDRECYQAGLFTIPIVGYASAGTASAPEYTNGDTPAGVGVLGEIDPAQDFGSGAYAIRIKGDSMLPRFRDGNVLVVSPTAEWSSGDICLVRHTDGRVWVKKIADRAGALTLEPDNPFYESIPLRRNEINYIHRVIVAVLR